MNSNDKFQMLRALESEQWARHPDRKIELLIDIDRRAKIDKDLGHSPRCSLSKCHPDCKLIK